MGENAMVRTSDVNVDDVGRIGKMLALSGYFESANNFDVAVAQMATKVLAGREMGFGPFASANGIHIIKGKPGVGANLMASAVKSHPRYNYRVREMTGKICRIEFFERSDSGEWESIGVSEFTEADARAAGTQNMNKFARNMLFARAMSNGVRWFCPDVFNGNSVYVPEELGADVDDEGNVTAQYTVHKPTPPQNGNGGTHETIDVSMDDVDEDTAGHLATPHEQPAAEDEEGTQACAAEQGEATPVWQTWRAPQDAYAWAVASGMYTGDKAARAAFATVVSMAGGKLSKSNLVGVFQTFHDEAVGLARAVPA